jgi:hypothetical protein
MIISAIVALLAPCCQRTAVSAPILAQNGPARFGSEPARPYVAMTDAAGRRLALIKHRGSGGYLFWAG